jgi:hypothetical protein
VHPWAQALRARLGVADVGEPIPDLRVDPGLVTGGGAALSAPVIAPGVWSAIDVGSSSLAQTLEHTWEEPLVPDSIAQTGPPERAAALAAAFVAAVDADPRLLLRWRGHGDAVSPDRDAWIGGAMPTLPAPARRPPDSVPKRFGSSGIAHAGDDIVEAFVRVYGAFDEA